MKNVWEVILFTKICKRCKTPYQYETEEEHKQFFYKKGNYFQNVCKQCTLKEHSEKYKDGPYNYRKKYNQDYYDMRYSIGNLSRCSFVSEYDNKPFHNRKFRLKSWL